MPSITYFINILKTYNVMGNLLKRSFVLENDFRDTRVWRRHWVGGIVAEFLFLVPHPLFAFQWINSRWMCLALHAFTRIKHFHGDKNHLIQLSVPNYKSFCSQQPLSFDCSQSIFCSLRSSPFPHTDYYRVNFEGQISNKISNLSCFIQGILGKTGLFLNPSR